MIGFNSSNRGGDEQNSVPPQNNSNNTDTIPNPPPQPVLRYGECLKNHAANVGRHVTDGCGEFMPSGEEPLKCAACDCHRSFHRREAEGDAANTATAPYYPYNLAHRATIGHLVPPPPAAPTTTTPQHRYGRAAGLPVMMEFGGGAAAESTSEEMEMIRMNHDGGGQSAAARKRFRTKFTSEQKGRMREFAERIGWKIQKSNEAEVQQFCAEVGVKRQVFKVWMHNCNQALKRKQS